jgi:hypothetical protein
VRVNFQVKLEKAFTLPQPPPLKVGPEKGLVEVLESLGELVTCPRAVDLPTPTEEVEVTRTVRVEAGTDSNYENFKFESASLVVEGLGPIFVSPPTLSEPSDPA